MSSLISVDFTPLIREKISGLKLGLLIGRKLFVNKKSDLVEEHFHKLHHFIQQKFDSMPPSADQTVSAVRRMYRRIGWEPTQYRPSSEAMIRRFLKNTGLYRINNLVDLGNITSTRFHLPMGLYDTDKIMGSIWIDVGQEEETYQGISKNLIHAAGKLVLRDGAGIFGNPTADSRRTSINEGSKNILAVFFTPPEISDSLLTETLSFLGDLYKQECPNALLSESIIHSFEE